MKQLFWDTPFADIQDFIVEQGEKKFRYKQIIDWIFKKSVLSFSKMNNIPKKLKDALSNNYALSIDKETYTVESPSGDSIKFGLKLADNSIIEAVILKSKKRRTLCVSSQVGCALGCTFCETGKMGLKRNLTVGEILYQLAVANNYLAKVNERITNIVFMGMGEALSNFDNFVTALKIITDESLFAIGRRKITVSTAGVLPNIQKLIDNNIQIELAISLNSSSNEERSEVMPINNKYPIEQLMEQARKYAKFRGRDVTFEYVLIKGKNDSYEAAQRLIKLFKNYPGKINIIPLNDCTTDGLSRPEEDYINKFSKWIHNAGITVTVRRSGGQDIDGACGQLAGRVSKEND